MKDPKKNPRSANRDRHAVRIFPWLVAACVVFTFLVAVIRGNYELWSFLNQTCAIFSAGFAVFGVWAVIRIDRGPFPMWVLAGVSAVSLTVIWLILTRHSTVMFLRGLTSLDEIGPVKEWFLAVDLAVTILVISLATVGVLTIVSAMLKKYIPGVLRSVETDKNGAASKFFMVPDIIDVEEVRLEPIIDDRIFDSRSFLWLFGYTFALGVMICSMLFLNPIILETVPDYIIMRLMILLSLFLPAMVIPWLAVRSAGAKVISSAPRPFYLWVGARKRLFTGFAALGLFFFSFLVSIYYGNSVETIAGYYLIYLVPLAAVSLISGVFYANCFSADLRDAICRRFEEKKAGR